MIIVRCMGGLGNQFFQYALYRQLSRTREARLDISWYSREGKVKFQLDAFGAEYRPADVSDVRALSDTSPSFLGRMKKKFFRKRSHRREDQSRFNTEVFSCPIGKSVYLDGYWQSPLYFTDAEAEIIDMIFPQKSRPSFRDAVSKAAGGRPTVSVHVRRGDYVSDSQMELVPSAWYDSAVAALREAVPGARFLVCSDDIGYARTLFSGDDFVFVDWNKNAVDDLYTMASCDHNIIANSSFSWWGAFLLDDGKKRVVYPRRWFRKIRDSGRISFMFPPTWTAL